MLGFEYGEIFRVREDIKISFILVGNIWNFILELIKFIKNLTRETLKEISISDYAVSRRGCVCPVRKCGKMLPFLEEKENGNTLGLTGVSILFSEREFYELQAFGADRLSFWTNQGLTSILFYLFVVRYLVPELYSL